jgi:diadenosine tetraphosphate (Ap4A) HIT family hydrolase
MQACPLCSAEGQDVLWQDDFCRVILVDDADYPGFCRVILNAHVKEMTDLTVADRERLMRVVWAVEAAVRDELAPDKINLASLGNVVPHLHWHVIPRFADDRHFPDPVWVVPRRLVQPRPIEVALAERLAGRLAIRLGDANDGP